MFQKIQPSKVLGRSTSCLRQVEQMELVMVISIMLLPGDLNCGISHSPWTSLNPQGTFPKDSSWQVPEATKICIYGVQGCSFALCSAQPLHTTDRRATPAFSKSPVRSQVCKHAKLYDVLRMFSLGLLSYTCLQSSQEDKSVSQRVKVRMRPHDSIQGSTTSSDRQECS